MIPFTTTEYFEEFQSKKYSIAALRVPISCFQVACKLATCQDKDTYVICSQKLEWHDEMESPPIDTLLRQS